MGKLEGKVAVITGGSSGAGHVPANQPDGFFERLLPPARFWKISRRSPRSETNTPRR